MFSKKYFYNSLYEINASNKQTRRTNICRYGAFFDLEGVELSQFSFSEFHV